MMTSERTSSLKTSQTLQSLNKYFSADREEVSLYHNSRRGDSKSFALYIIRSRNVQANKKRNKVSIEKYNYVHLCAMLYSNADFQRVSKGKSQAGKISSWPYSSLEKRKYLIGLDETAEETAWRFSSSFQEKMNTAKAYVMHLLECIGMIFKWKRVVSYCWENSSHAIFQRSFWTESSSCNQLSEYFCPLSALEI